MSTWNSIGGAICVAISAAGLIASWLVWRKKGAISGMRGVAWALIPLGVYLTGSVLLIGRIASAIARFAGAFVFSPKSWAGLIVLAVAVLLFAISGGLPLLKWRKSRERRKVAGRAGRPDEAVGQGARTAPGSQPAVAAPRRKPAEPHRADPDDDMSEIEAILRQRGIK
ncbi:MAG TPA: cellulose synthase [Streptosporangiaceae bacterium]|nr:cellulose synthase [Streptosporangiaceae bacterium]